MNLSEDDATTKTEPPSPHRLEQARRQGDVALSRDVVQAAGLMAALGAAAIGLPWAGERLLALFEALWAALDRPFDAAGAWLAEEAWTTALVVCAGAWLPVALGGLLAARWQTGGVWAPQRVAPRLKHLDPGAGLRRLWSARGAIEVFKACAKTLALLAVGWLAVRGALGPLQHLPWSGRVSGLAAAFGQVGSALAVGALGVSMSVAALDWLAQRRRHRQSLRMSPQERRREAREQEGDPQMKARRRQQHQDLARRPPMEAARQAHVLLVNPTHLAVAVDYDRHACPVPMVSAKGADALALALREAAEAAGVPVLHHVALARELHGRAEVGDLVPADLFEVMAEVILWAREWRAASALPLPDDGVARPGGVADPAAGG